MFNDLVARTLLPHMGQRYFRELLFFTGAGGMLSVPPFPGRNPLECGFKPRHSNAAPALFYNEITQHQSGICNAPPDSGIISDFQISGSRCITESLVVIGSALAAIFHTGLKVPKMYHFMQQCRSDVFSRTIQCASPYIELVALFLTPTARFSRLSYAHRISACSEW